MPYYTSLLSVIDYTILHRHTSATSHLGHQVITYLNFACTTRLIRFSMPEREAEIDDL